MIDLTGQRFGRLIALNPTEKRCCRSVVWHCICDCGNEIFVTSGRLKSGHTKSCGCFRKDVTSKIHKTHGMSNTSLHNIWRGMFDRCYNPNSKIYKYYGGRGIIVCERWHSFENFYADMGNRPKGLTLERKNNDGNYGPENCEWASRKAQRNNQRPRSRGPCKQRWFRAWHKDSMTQYLSNNQGEFARQWKLNQAHISECLLGKAKQHKGWSFALQEVLL